MFKLVNYLEASTFMQGMGVGFLVWFGFLATNSLKMVLWEHKPFSLYLLTIFHDFFVFLIMGGILAVWA